MTPTDTRPLPAEAGEASALAQAMSRASLAAVVVAVAALLGLLVALVWPPLTRPALGLLLGVPVVRNVVLVFGARGRERALAVLGIALLAVVLARTMQ